MQCHVSSHVNNLPILDLLKILRSPTDGECRPIWDFVSSQYGDDYDDYDD